MPLPEGVHPLEQHSSPTFLDHSLNSMLRQFIDMYSWWFSPSSLTTVVSRCMVQVPSLCSRTFRSFLTSTLSSLSILMVPNVTLLWNPVYGRQMSSLLFVYSWFKLETKHSDKGRCYMEWAQRWYQREVKKECVLLTAPLVTSSRP